MPTTDGTVEIKITGSVDPSVAAAANEAKASLDAVGASASGLRPGFDASAASLKQLIAQTGSFAAAQKALAAANGDMGAALLATRVAQEVETEAVKAGTAATINSRAAYESLVLIHEAMQGRFTRMAGSSMILTQALAGQAATTKFVQAALSSTGLTIIGTTIAMGTLLAATISMESEEKKLTATSIGLGAQSGLTAKQLKDIGESADSSTQSIRETTKAAEAFAAVGLHNADTVKTLSNSIESYSQLIGVKFADAQKKLASAMKDPVKGAQELHDELGILSGDQLEQIQRLDAIGAKDQAVAIITQALTERVNEAKDAGVGLRGEFGQLVDVLSNVYNWIGQVSEGFGREAETLLEDLIPALHQAAQAHRDVAAAASQQAQNEAALNDISAKGAKAFANTPEGRKEKDLIDLAGQRMAAEDAYTLAKARGDTVGMAQAKEAVDAYTHAITSYRTEAEKKVAIDKIDVQLAAAKHAHNKELVADLTQQKALIAESGKIETQADANALAKGAGDVGGARTFPKGGGKGPSIVSQWEEQLHAMEVASNDFFDDQTSTELKFWQSKLGLVKAGSKEWLDVQTKVYDAQKTLAHRDYDEHIADLNDRIEADRNDFTKFKADWQEKLDFIKSKYKEESTEYKNAHRQMEAETRQFEDRLIQEELSGNNKMVAALKKNLQEQQQIRQEYTKLREEQIADKAGNSPFGDISAITQIARLHHQMAQQEIQDAQTAYNAENALRAQGVADALRVYGQDDQRYKAALADKLNADKQYENQKRQLELKALNQQLQDLQRLKAAYHQYIDGTVSATVSGFANMADGTGTFREAVIGVYQSIKSAAIQAISTIVENWIVNLLVQKTASNTAAAAQVASYAGIAGAAGVASWAAAPWPIDAGAPGFGAAMSAAAAAFAPLASLDKGTNFLPQDMLVQAHQGERVVPRADNTKLIQLVSQAANNNTPNGGNGDVHLHFHGDIIGSRAGMEQWARQNRHMFGAGAKAYSRYGGNLDPNRRGG
jgi:phage-related minor tail protein